MDAGIVSESNLKELRKNGEKYVCVSRTTLKDYEDYLSGEMTTIFDKEENKIHIKLIDPDAKPDKWLLVKSEMKAKKESSIKTEFEQKFEQKLTHIEQGIHKKGGTKKIRKSMGADRQGQRKLQAGGRAGTILALKKKRAMPFKCPGIKKKISRLNIAGCILSELTWSIKRIKQIWNIYNTIREVESTFRCLKSDLRIRPIFHKKDKYSKAHIHLGLMAYQIVVAIRHRLKNKGIFYGWSNIVRIMNSQKMNTSIMEMRTKEVHIRKFSLS